MHTLEKKIFFPKGLYSFISLWYFVVKCYLINDYIFSTCFDIAYVKYLAIHK